MTRNNSGGRSTPRGQATKNESPEQAMESYDALPARIRHRLIQSPFNISPSHIKEELEAGRMTESQAISAINYTDMEAKKAAWDEKKSGAYFRR